MNKIVINTGPIIALGRMGISQIIAKLPYEFVSPLKVKAEIETGLRIGHEIELPKWIDFLKLDPPVSRTALANLDLGEAAVVELALQKDIKIVCIDETKGRKAAINSGLKISGSLGLLAKAKSLNLIEKVHDYIAIAQTGGIYYDETLIEKFLNSVGE